MGPANWHSIKLNAFILGTAVILAGCGPKVEWTPTNPSPTPMQKRAVSSVEVFEEEPPTREHVQVGVLVGSQKRSTTKDVKESVTIKLRQKAAAVGCDAIHVTDVSEPAVEGEKKQPPLTLQAGCLMWTGEEGVAAAPPPAPEPPPPPPATEAPPEPEPAAASAGCGNDMDCKGNRVCEEGKCVSPDHVAAGGTGGAAVEGEGNACKKDTDCPGDLVCQDKKCTKSK